MIGERLLSDRHVYNLSTEVLSSYLILLHENVKAGKRAYAGLSDEQQEAFDHQLGEADVAQSKQSMTPYFGLSSLYNREISGAVAELQAKSCISL